MNIKRFYILLFVALMFGNFSYAREEKIGSFLIDEEPFRKSWVFENDVWVLSLHFEKARIEFFFKDKPKSETFLGLSPENKPEKAEIRFFGGKPIILTHASFEIFDDGSYCWEISGKGSFSRLNQDFDSIIVEIRDVPNKQICNCNYWLSIKDCY